MEMHAAIRLLLRVSAQYREYREDLILAKLLLQISFLKVFNLYFFFRSLFSVVCTTRFQFFI